MIHSLMTVWTAGKSLKADETTSTRSHQHPRHLYMRHKSNGTDGKEIHRRNRAPWTDHHNSHETLLVCRGLLNKSTGTAQLPNQM